MKIWKTISAALLAGVTLIGCVGCGWTTGEYKDNTDYSQNDTSDRSGWVLRDRPSADSFENKVLNITYYNGGYGQAWIEEMKTEFEKDYPGVTVRLTASDNVTGTLQTELENSPDDIYISHDIAWETYGTKGLIADLTTDLYEATIYTDSNQDGLPIRFKDLLTQSSLTCSAYMGHYYKVAQVQGAGGIIYNKTLFDKHGWQIPETYEELEALCETIYQANVTPFLVAGTEGYLWDSLVYDWWIQIAGEEEFLRMYSGEDKTCWDPSVYPYQKQAYEYWYNLFVKNKDKYMLSGFEGMSNITANEMFVAGLAAMMPATSWAVNELGADVVEEAEIDVGLIPTPYVKEAKKDENGN